MVHALLHYSTTDDTAEPELIIFNETKQNETTP